MTPDFRHALFTKFHYSEDKHGKLEFCIPYQLQALFARLLLSVRPAVTTSALTHSFRWNAAEAFRVMIEYCHLFYSFVVVCCCVYLLSNQQHDVQELMRVLFSALEKSVPKSADRTIFNQV